MSFAALRPGPGRHCFHADFAQEHNTLSVFNCSLILSCISSSESRGILDSSGAKKLFLLYFFSHRFFCENMCSSPALSLGRLDCRLDQLYCFISIIIIIIIIIIITIFITIIFQAFKINRCFLYQ